MGKSSKPRKKYVPKPMLMPISYRAGNEAQTEWQIAAILAMDRFMEGNGSEELAYTIIGNMFVGRGLTNDTQEIETIDHGLNAMRGVIERSVNGKWGFSGDQYKAIKESVFVVDKLQAEASRRDMMKSLNKVMQMSLVSL